MLVNHVLICSDQYPTREDPVFTFVEQTAIAFAKLGVHVTVVAPQSLTKHFFRKTPLHPRYRQVKNDNGTIVEIFQPYNISFGNRFSKVNSFFERMSLRRALKKVNGSPQVCYGHFWHCAIGLYDYACKNRIPLFVASGEASVEKETCIRNEDVGGFLNYYKGVFFASSKNKKESIRLGFLTNQRNVILPNAIDVTKFFKKDKRSLRIQYGVDSNVFVVIFVGSFINRKGPRRVAEALKKINNGNIKAFFIGCEKDGVAYPFDYEGCLYKGVIPHEKLVDYLNMADVFVLPTLAEGCCNAIIEAMACELPIISSDREFNDDILDESCSIRVNPESVDDIALAIRTLYNNRELCEKMGAAALLKASSMTIENRAKAILCFMNECIGMGK